MMDKDEQAFVDFARSDPGVCLFMDRMTDGEIHPIDTLPNRAVPGWLMLWLWHTVISLRPKLRYVDEQQYHVVDFYASEVIQFSRSYLDDKRLVRGRIWAEFRGWNRGNPSSTIQKSDSFKKWFHRLASWIRRKAIKDPSGDYLLPGAVDYWKGGGILCQLPLASGVKLIHHV